MSAACASRCFGSTRVHGRTLKIRCSAVPETSAIPRRAVLASILLLGPAVGAVAPAMARDAKEAAKEREARRAALRAAAQASKESGKDRQVFAMPEYSMSEAARTPNVHTRQDEGARTQENV